MNTATAEKQNKIMYISQAENFFKIPGSPIAYWVSDAFLAVFMSSKELSQYGDARQGLITGNNDRFLRFWHEVKIKKFSLFGGEKWFPYNKGGEFRKWFGNNTLLVNWKNDGDEIKNYRDEKGKQLSRPQNTQYYGREGITWTALTSGLFNGRYSPISYIFDAKGSSFFTNGEDVWMVLSYLNSKVANYLLSVTSPTLDYNAGVVARLPFKQFKNEQVQLFAKESQKIAKEDWDSFETSWDFKKHPLV